MTSCFPVGRRLRGAFSPTFALSALCLALSAYDLCAQVGNNNPGGVSGIFNGQINTGCSYDPYTGNATRSITDIAVAGALGDYQLALVRIGNSRTPTTSEVFGSAGGWNHNYNWTMEDSPVGYTQNFAPSQYTVNFPDGRVETFKAVTWDSTCYRVRASNGENTSSAGVQDRLAPINAEQNNFDAYLVLPDGGKVKFHATQHNYQGQYHYTYKATAIIDPYGLQTTLSWESVNGRNRLTRVQEPAGRYLQITYSGNGPRISQIQEFINGVGRRAVQYYYSYTMLDHVVYYGNPNWTASYQYAGSNAGQNLPPLLWTCDDPMYPGAMRRIAYQYKTGNNPDGSAAVYGQILRERYWDGVAGHEANGTPVSELTVGASNPVNHNIRTEKRANNPNLTRTFTYSAVGYLTWMTDFMGHSANQTYDSHKWINSVTNFRRITTDYICDPTTGNVTQIRFPLTPDDTPGQGNTRPTINYTYTNNHYLQSIQDEAGNTTTITRDGNNRVTQIDYPDGGYETLGYDTSHFYQVSSHRMTTGGTETFAYDASGRLQYYSDPYHNNTNNSTTTCYYDGLDRISRIVDTLNHSTNFDYNDRGQVTVTTLPWINGVRYTISNLYNSDGTLQTRTDELGHVTIYEYDDYRRLKRVTPPVRGFGDNGTNSTNLYYDVNGTGDDYRYTDSNVSWVILPSGKKTKTTYDDNRRKQSMILAPGTTDEATSSYGYDNVGNVTSVANLRNRTITTVYDERNRPSQIHDSYGNITNFTYDTRGRLKTITRPNGQLITNASFDEMNRVLQQNVTQTPDPLAVTKYTYYPSGLIHTMTDPRNSTDSYTCLYDLMGRTLSVTYPADLNGNHFVERSTYDTVGRLQSFKNRKGDVQTFNYDALNRLSYFTWDDNLTPRVDFDYDAASRLTGIDNGNARITRAYFNDNLLRSETELITGGGSKQIAYTYNPDGGRANVTYPDYQPFAYTYTRRNQLKTVGPWATYIYDENGYTGDLTTRTLNNGTHSTYLYDPLDRVTWITHLLTSGSRGFNYGYDDVSLGNCRYIRRTGTTLGDRGDVFSYDLADQAMGVGLNVTSPQSTPAPPRSILYDANGNRTTYAINDLNQYTSRNANNATYNANGDITITPDPQGTRSSYDYDAQNRLLSAGKGNVTMYFTYDGLNRQVSRKIGVNGTPIFGVWDGWDLIEEYESGGTVTAKYVYGRTGLIKELVNNRYYYQDGSGSTSHLANSSGGLLEWYRYDLQGTPIFYDAGDHQLSASGLAVRHLFTGQQWYQELGLYDLRHRFYSPDLARFLQPDPIGFRGGNNLYRYCQNNPVTRSDPFGLLDPANRKRDPGSEYYNGTTGESWYVGSGPEDPSNFGVSDNGWTDGAVVSGDGPLNFGGDSGGASGAAPGGIGGLGGLGGPGGLGGVATGDGGPGGKTLANSPATSFLGKFLQGFNAQGDWKKTAEALDTFASFEVSLLFFGEGRVALGVARYVLPASVRATFVRGTIQSKILQKPMTVFRYWGGRSQQVSNYFATADTVAQISSPNSAGIALNLMPYNTAAQLDSFVIPAGNRIWYGGIAGGADSAAQVYVLNPDVVVLATP